MYGLCMSENSPSHKHREQKSKAELIEELDALDQLNNHENARRFELFSRISPAWFWEMDENLHFTFMSPQVEDILGVPAGFHIGKTRAELAGEAAHTDKWREHMADLEAHRPFRKFGYVRKGHDGRLQYISSSGDPIFDADGRFRGYAGIGEDQTENEEVKESYRSVRDSYKTTEQRLTTALEAINDGFVLFDADDRFVLSNQKYREMFSAVEEFLVPGMPFEDIVRATVECGLLSTGGADEETWIKERSQLHKNADTQFEQHLEDGTWLRIEDHKTSTGEVVGIRLNITDLKKGQEELERARVSAETASLAKTNFLSTMSHEIRTPLNGVLGLAQLLSGTDLNTEQQKQVDNILASGETLLSIINDVLDMSKIEAGGLDLEETTFNLDGVISAISPTFQSMATDRGLTFEVNNSLSKSEAFLGDPLRLRQIIWNLLSNAIKFTEQGGVKLDVSEISRPRSPLKDFGGRTIRVAVEDTGTGIADDRLPFIFDAFIQEDSSITRKFGGTGLGLSIVKQIIDLMGGEINAESAVGKGTTFEVYLPFDIAREEDVDDLRLMDGSADISANEHLNVLVAEDNNINAMIAVAFLRKFGHTARVAVNGKLAVAAVKEERPDLILMDIHMPEVDGVMATKILRSMDEYRDLPIVGLTAEAFADRHDDFITAGMQYVMTKPFTEQQLNATINRYGRSGTGAGAAVSRQSPKGVAKNGNDGERALLSEIGDTARMSQMIEALGLEQVRSLLESAPDGLRARGDDIHIALEKADADAVYAAAHAIKGIAGSLYALRLPEIAAEIEQAVNDLDSVRARMTEFDEVVRNTIAWWQTMVRPSRD
jgi:PAS domain S-box-containing protein